MRGSKFCFTINEDVDAFVIRLPVLYQNEKEDIRYICGQVEIAPTTGNRHFQGYVQLKNSQRISWLRNHIHPTGHYELQKARKNSLARAYCMKEDTRAEGAEFVELGVFSIGKGSRTDLISLREAIKSGSTHRELIETHCNTYGKHTRFADRCFALIKPKANPEGVKVILYYGPPGTGKTRRAYSEDPNLYCTPICNGALWLDGYDRENTVLLDDFSGALSKWSLTETLRLLDRYAVMVPIKGSFAWWSPKTIIITTNIHPYRWYKWNNRESQYQALHRRFHEVWYFPVASEAELQDNDTFFYDEELIWPPVVELYRPLPTPPNWFLENQDE